MSLTVRDLCFSYPGRPRLLADVQLDVHPGESVALMAPSGAGKSTLLALVGGLLAPDSGSLTLHGVAVRGTRHASWVRQSMDLLTRRTLVDNVSLPLLARGITRDSARMRALSELEALGLAHLASVRVCDVSGGEGQRTAVARAAVLAPDVLLADEPTANLDRHNADTVATSLATRFGDSIVLIATHDPAVAALAGRRLGIADGIVTEQP